MATPPFLPDESKPADADIVSQYPAVERLFRDIVESWLLIDHDTDGEHKQITLPERADPGAVANTGILYTKDDSTDTELFYIDDSGNVVQITQDGGPGPEMAAFPAGTIMFFHQAAAPTGWTKKIAIAFDNSALRLVTDTAWVSGRQGATAFDSVFGSGKTAGATTLTAAQSGVPAHTHPGPDGHNFVFQPVSGANLGDGGASQAHTHALTGSNTAASAASSHNHTLSLDLNYINIIMATKD